jgi:hypothetical protein
LFLGDPLGSTIREYVSSQDRCENAR